MDGRMDDGCDGRTVSDGKYDKCNVSKCTNSNTANGKRRSSKCDGGGAATAAAQANAGAGRWRTVVTVSMVDGRYDDDDRRTVRDDDRRMDGRTGWTTVRKRRARRRRAAQIARSAAQTAQTAATAIRQNGKLVARQTAHGVERSSQQINARATKCSKRRRRRRQTASTAANGGDGDGNIDKCTTAANTANANGGAIRRRQ